MQEVDMNFVTGVRALGIQQVFMAALAGLALAVLVIFTLPVLISSVMPIALKLAYLIAGAMTWAIWRVCEFAGSEGSRMYFAAVATAPPQRSNATITDDDVWDKL
jgi:hypothetical protein